jgi:hypothetical protein
MARHPPAARLKWLLVPPLERMIPPASPATASSLMNPKDETSLATFGVSTL